jgi:protein-disulfide isomerase-like protein with CxxC motif
VPGAHTERTGVPFLPATAAARRLGDLPLGSLQSRAAARSVIAARAASEEGGLLFQTKFIVDGKRVNFDDLADQIRGAVKE